MTYKSIATVLHDAEDAHGLLEYAIAAARDWGAHLHVHCTGIDLTEPGFYYAGVHAIAVQENLELAQAEADAIETAVRNRLMREDILWDITTARLMIDGLTPWLSDQLRFNDMVILPRPYGPGRARADVQILEAALFGALRPVLVLPPAMPERPAFDKVIFAWDDGSEALSACRAALPLLKKAKVTDITIIDPPLHSADRSDPGGRLATYLSANGIRADISVLPRKTTKLADQLGQIALEQGAGLLVMGAYSHARVREALFGGVTRDMLESAQVPLLMAR